MTNKDTLKETGQVRYDPSTQQFRYTLDYDIPDNITELTIEINLPRLDSISVSETHNVVREGDTSFVWKGGTAPQIVFTQRVGGDTFSSGVQGTYGTDSIALAGRIRTQLPYRYNGTPPTRQQTLTFDGKGFASGGYVYAGPHDAYIRDVAGTQLGVVVPEVVNTAVPHEELLDAYAFGERTISRRLPRSKMTAFVIPSDWYRHRGVAVRTDVLLDDQVANVDTINSVATHEYIHTGFGVFGNGEMYWLREGIAQYYGYLLALNAGSESFSAFHTEVTATRHRATTLTDSETMRTTSADYHKGAHVLAALDAKIQEYSKDQTTLNDILITNDHDLSTYDGFRTAVTQATGSSMLDVWLDQYVRSPAIPEVPNDPQYYVLGDRTAKSLRTETEPRTETAGAWQTKTMNNATVKATSEEVTIKVKNCSSGTATRTVEAGQTLMSFDYEIEAEGWWEQPYCEILVDGDIVWMGGVDEKNHDEGIFEITANGTTTGRVEKTIGQSDPVEIRLGIAPSDYCSAPDHGLTSLRVTNFRLQPQATATTEQTATPKTTTQTPIPTNESPADSRSTGNQATSADGTGFSILGALGSLTGAGYLLDRQLDSND